MRSRRRGDVRERRRGRWRGQEDEEDSNNNIYYVTT